MEEKEEFEETNIISESESGESEDESMSNYEDVYPNKRPPVLEVLNVGQGDSIIMRVPENSWNGINTYLVDLGNGSVDVADRVSGEDKVTIILTHHHADHVGGFKYFAGKMNKVEHMLLPYCQNEITLMAKALLNLKGIENAVDCSEFVNDLQNIVNGQQFICSIAKSHGSQLIRFVRQGSPLGSSLECLNPPVMFEQYDWINAANRIELEEIMNDLFTPEFTDEIGHYFEGVRRFYPRRGYREEGERDFFRSVRWFDEWMSETSRSWIPHDLEYDFDFMSSEEIFSRANMLYGFIFKNLPLMLQFNRKSNRKNMRKVYKQFVKTCHDACIVLKADCYGKSFLLTGDASKKVFNRLINEYTNISADYLKVPHHGSKNNMSESILAAIKPKVAIISHKNGRFGKAKDTHPNIETLNMLHKRRVRIVLTNSVRKNNHVYMRKMKFEDTFVKVD